MIGYEEGKRRHHWLVLVRTKIFSRRPYASSKSKIGDLVKIKSFFWGGSRV